MLGGHHSLDWSDVKYYYNPNTERIEPVAYESVSAFETRKLCGSYNYVVGENVKKTFHQQLFTDATFFKAYIREVEKIVSKDDLETFFTSVDQELNEKLNIIYSEFPYKDYSTDVYFKNQKKIQAILDEPRPYQVFLQEFDTSKMKMTLALGIITQLPYEIKSISCGSEKIRFSNVITPSKSPNDLIEYNNYTFTVSQKFIEKLQKGKTLEMDVSILGASKVKTLEVFAYPYQHTLKQRSEKISGLSFFQFNQDSTMAYLTSGAYEFSDTIVLPLGTKLTIDRATTITMLGNSQIIVNGDIEFIGGRDDEDHITFIGTGENNIIQVQSNKKKFSKLKYVLFDNVALCCSNAQLNVEHVAFVNNTNAICLDKSYLTLVNSTVSNVSKTLIAYNSTFKVSGTSVSNSDVFIESANSKGEVFNSNQIKVKKFLNELSASEIVKVERKKGSKYVK